MERKAVSGKARRLGRKVRGGMADEEWRQSKRRWLHSTIRGLRMYFGGGGGVVTLYTHSSAQLSSFKPQAPREKTPQHCILSLSSHLIPNAHASRRFPTLRFFFFFLFRGTPGGPEARQEEKKNPASLSFLPSFPFPTHPPRKEKRTGKRVCVIVE